MDRDDKGGLNKAYERKDGPDIPHTELPEHLKNVIVEKRWAPDHPSSNPHFDPKREHEVWYLAHPLAADDKYTFQQNMDHVVHCLRICYDEGIIAIAPYHTICLALDDQNAEHHRIGLECDLNVVRKLKRVILVGHKISKGMLNEKHACRDVGGIHYDFTCLNDSDLRSFLAQVRHDTARRLRA